MQLELEVGLEEINWIIRCHNCEALNCPQEEYPARLLPTPPPSYIDNLESRLIKVREGIFPASLKMILKTNYPLPVRRPKPETSVQPDDVIAEHRAGENSPSSQCDPSPRRVAVNTGSEKPGTPPRSPAIGTGSGSGVSQTETQIMEKEEIFLFEASVVCFLRSNSTSPKQECILLKSDIGVDDNDEATASSVQAGAREESASLPIGQQQGMTAWSTDQNRQFDRGRSRVNPITFLKRYMFAMCTCLFFPVCFVCCLWNIFPVLSINCRSRYERRYELFGCTGCVNCCIRRGAFTISIFRRWRVFSVYLCLFVLPLKR